MTRRTVNRRGFTLWEMAIVLGIVAVSAVIVVPRLWVSFGEEPAAQTGDALVAVLRESRRIAIENGMTVQLTLDPESLHYRVDTTGVSGTGALAEGVLDTGAWESLVTPLPRLRYIFRPTGAAIGDSVRVRGGDQSVLVTVDPWNGEAIVSAR